MAETVHPGIALSAALMTQRYSGLKVRHLKFDCFLVLLGL